MDIRKNLHILAYIPNERRSFGIYIKLYNMAQMQKTTRTTDAEELIQLMENQSGINHQDWPEEYWDEYAMEMMTHSPI